MFHLKKWTNDVKKPYYSNTNDQFLNFIAMLAFSKSINQKKIKNLLAKKDAQWKNSDIWQKSVGFIPPKHTQDAGSSPATLTWKS